MSVVTDHSCGCRVHKVRIAYGGECFSFIEYGIYLLKCSFFAVVGFSKCKSLYLNEREKCYGRQIRI